MHKMDFQTVVIQLEFDNQIKINFVCGFTLLQNGKLLTNFLRP